MFAGNTGDPATVAAQVTRLKDRFGITRVVLVGDRGMLTAARLREERRSRRAGLDHRAARPAGQGPGPRRRPAADPVRPDRPGRDHLPGLPRRAAGRLQNPFLEAEQAGKRESLLKATEADLAKIAGPARGPRTAARQDKIAVRANRVLAAARSPSASPSRSPATASATPRPGLHHRRGRPGRHLRAARSVGPGDLDSGDVVSSYKALAQVERAFRAFNTDLDIPRSGTAPGTRPRARVLADAVVLPGWHLQARLAPLLFTDDDKPAAQAARPSPVSPPPAPARPGQTSHRHPPGDLPVHSFATLLADLATICLNTIAPPTPPCPASGSSPPTALQRQAFELLGVSHRLGVA